ncbi:MAG: bifunctional ornithine acetyltransferase/N-acetylglutamate synthase [Chloroflexota bacterium]
MTTISEPTVLEPLPSQLPSVERRAVMPAGFRAAGRAIGIKASGRPDLAVIVTTEGPAAAAGVFTSNAFAAAPVGLTRANFAATSGDARGGFGLAGAVICTSGSANAATGQAGWDDQVEVARLLADVAGTSPDRTVLLSTGVIGTRLPVDRIADGLSAVRGDLAASNDALHAAATAFRTTDSVTKVATTAVDLPGKGGGSVRVTVTGIAKGVGMIHPNMATMLAVLLTDAAVEPETLWGLLRPAAARTWDQISVDGDTSTNDSAVVLASGSAPNAPIDPGSAAAAALGGAIEAVARDLARQQAADGEGATTLITAQVSGAGDDADARAVARAIVSSSLVKAAVHGRDPNWGRIGGAIGNARLGPREVLEAAGVDNAEATARGGTPARVDPRRVRIAIGGHAVFDGAAGGPLSFDRAAARAAMDSKELLIRVDLGLGGGTGEAFGCDLTEQYVLENSEYTT